MRKSNIAYERLNDISLLCIRSSKPVFEISSHRISGSGCFLINSRMVSGRLSLLEAVCDSLEIEESLVSSTDKIQILSKLHEQYVSRYPFGYLCIFWDENFDSFRVKLSTFSDANHHLYISHLDETFVSFELALLKTITTLENIAS